MTRLIGGMLASVCVVALSGCHPAFTRVPDLALRTPQQEKLEANYFDPLPDHNAGPSTDHRPAGFELPRTMPRQALEKRSVVLPLRLPGEPSPPEARLNPKFSNVVQP